MSIIRSDNRAELHPKPTQEYERKFNGSGYVDWASQSEVTNFFNTTTGLNVSYMKNKYFWINGALFNVADDGTTFKQTSGSGNVKALRFKINSNGIGSHDSTFDGYLAAGNTVTISALNGFSLVYIIVNRMIYQGFFNDGVQVSLSGSVLDCTNLGGLNIGDWLIVMFI